ncbi:MAG: prepilin peptidase [Acidobacteria bacterium]|nr:prepilin peptidase [Acidobacteriota bacterium]
MDSATKQAAIATILVLSAAMVTIYDLRRRRIPNWLTALIASSGFTVQIADSGLRGGAAAMAGMLTGLAVLAIPYVLGGIGAGDLKLMGAMGALVGWKGLLILFLLSALFGGLLAAAALLVQICRRRPSGRGPDSASSPPRTAPPRSIFGMPAVTIPYGVAISCGAVVFAGMML